MPRARPSKSAMRVRVSSTASTSDSSVNRRCGTSNCVGWPAPQWSATNNPADHFVHMVGKQEVIRASLVGKLSQLALYPTQLILGSPGLDNENKNKMI